MSFEILVILALIVLNGYLTLSEMAIVSSSRARLQSLANQGKAGAKTAIQLLEAPSEMLASIQVGITLVGVFIGAFGGTTLSAKIAHWIETTLPLLAAYATPLSLALVVVVSSFLQLIIGELVPKRLALAHPEIMASHAARSVQIISALAKPGVRLLSFSTEFCLKLLNLDKIEETRVTEDEVKILVEQGTEAGVFEQGEETIIKRTLRLGSLSAGDIMTPRTKIVSFDINDPCSLILERIRETQHTYFPVYDGQMDNLVGLLSAKKVLYLMSDSDQAWDIRTCMLEPFLIPESVSVLDVLDTFKEKGAHVAVVIDEYGGLAGLVTILDMMEALVGTLPHDIGDQSHRLVRREDGSILLDGVTSLHEFEEIFEVDFSAFTDGEDIQTIAGLIMKQMGRIPKEGDIILLAHLKIEVIDMDGRRVDKILVDTTQDIPLAPGLEM